VALAALPPNVGYTYRMWTRKWCRMWWRYVLAFARAYGRKTPIPDTLLHRSRRRDGPEAVINRPYDDPVGEGKDAGRTSLASSRSACCCWGCLLAPKLPAMRKHRARVEPPHHSWNRLPALGLLPAAREHTAAGPLTVDHGERAPILLGERGRGPSTGRGTMMWAGIGHVVGVARQDRKAQRLAVRLDFHEHLVRVGSGLHDAHAGVPRRGRRYRRARAKSANTCFARCRESSATG
jgi:hypothetical protein